MKKILVALFVFLFSVSSVFAYTPNYKDKQIVEQFNSSLKKLPYKKLKEVKGRLDKIRPQFKGQDTRISYLLQQIAIGIDNALEDIPASVMIKEIVGNSEDDRDGGKKLVNVELLEVIDGDTIKVMLNSKKITVRLIGVDAPEKGETYADEAKKYLETSFRQYARISLEYDSSQGKTDKYGRHLAYVILSGFVNMNERLIQSGYAKEYTYNKPYKYQEIFKNAEKGAKKSKLNIWKNDTETKKDTGFYKISGECAIKGNINSKKEKIYHYPGCQAYNKTKINLDQGERLFCSKEEAEAAGWRVAGNCH